MGDRIGRGSYLVTHTKSRGGNHNYDITRVVKGYGIVSDPWIVLSLLSGLEYKVSATEIVKESYHSNCYLEDAKGIYAIHTGKPPDLPKPPDPDCTSVHFP